MAAGEHMDDSVAQASASWLREKVQRGVTVAVALAVLTAIEYAIAVGVDNPTIWLVPFAIAKGVLILEYFMHFSGLIGGGNH